MLDYRTQMKEGGRIVVPAPIRKKLHMEAGDELVLWVENGELHISTLSHAIKQAQETVSKYNPSHKQLTKELFALRKEDKNHE